MALARRFEFLSTVAKFVGRSTSRFSDCLGLVFSGLTQCGPSFLRRLPELPFFP
jgi:hypothetical protein